MTALPALAVACLAVAGLLPRPLVVRGPGEDDDDDEDERPIGDPDEDEGGGDDEEEDDEEPLRVQQQVSKPRRAFARAAAATSL